VSSSAPGSPSAVTPIRRVSWVALVAIFGALLLYGVLDGTSARTKGEHSAELATRYACPTCDGQSVAESQAPVALNIRREIERLVDDGRSDEEIEAALVNDYGQAVLLNPGADGVVGLVWILPVVALVLAVAGLVILFIRWGGRSAEPATEGDRSLVAEALANLPRNR